jgi:hypothetical protein
MKRALSAPVIWDWKQDTRPMGQLVDIARRTEPVVGRSTPEIRRKSVDLPAPLAPQMARLSRREMAKERFETVLTKPRL